MFYVIEVLGGSDDAHREQLAQLLAPRGGYSLLVRRAWVQSTDPTPDLTLTAECSRAIAARVEAIVKAGL